MNQRCHNPKHPAFALYGGRGITVHEPWRTNFNAFFSHIGPKPFPHLSLDRIDNSLGYAPGNVRWATYQQQGRNRRSNRIVTFNGEQILLCELCDRTGLSEPTIAGRLRLGWTIESAVSTPTHKRGPKNRISFANQQTTLAKLESTLGFGRGVLRIRISRGKSLEQAIAMGRDAR
jgi:hypothetical protein